MAKHVTTEYHIRIVGCHVVTNQSLMLLEILCDGTSCHQINCDSDVSLQNKINIEVLNKVFPHAFTAAMTERIKSRFIVEDYLVLFGCDPILSSATLLKLKKGTNGLAPSASCLMIDSVLKSFQQDYSRPYG